MNKGNTYLDGGGGVTAVTQDPFVYFHAAFFCTV